MYLGGGRHLCRSTRDRNWRRCWKGSCKKHMHFEGNVVFFFLSSFLSLSYVPYGTHYAQTNRYQERRGKGSKPASPKATARGRQVCLRRKRRRVVETRRQTKTDGKESRFLRWQSFKGHNRHLSWGVHRKEIGARRRKTSNGVRLKYPFSKKRRPVLWSPYHDRSRFRIVVFWRLFLDTTRVRQGVGFPKPARQIGPLASSQWWKMMMSSSAMTLNTRIPSAFSSLNPCSPPFIPAPRHLPTPKEYERGCIKNQFIQLPVYPPQNSRTK